MSEQKQEPRKRYCEVKDCVSCPNRRISGTGRTHTCMISGGHRLTLTMGVFPSWCPLSEACSRPHPAPAITEDDLVKEISDAFDRGYKVGFAEGQTDGTENEKLRVSDIARKAREQVLQQVIDYCNKEAKENPDDEAWYDSTMEKVVDYCESLQAHQAGEQHE